MLPHDIAELQRTAQQLRAYLTSAEQRELDRLLISPAREVQRYRYNPIAFAREVLHIDLTPYQETVMTKMVQHRRVCLRGPRGTGKSTIAAVAVLWFLAVYEECKVITTTSVWRQLIEFLWPEIHKWAMQADWWRVGLQCRPGKELFAQKIEFTKNRFATAVSSNDESKVEGAHSEAVLYIFDEAKIIPDAIWDSAEGALGTTKHAFALAMSTPGDNVGRFYDIQTKRERFPNWHCIAVTLDECIAAGRVVSEWVEAMKRQWGETSAMYRRHVLGQFAEDEADSLITLDLIERAQARWSKKAKRVDELIAAGQDQAAAEREVWGDLTHIGIDPAHMGSDKTGWAFRYGSVIRRVERHAKENTMDSAGRAVAAMQNNTAVVRIDANGLGVGVYDRLAELHHLGNLRTPPDQVCPIFNINGSTGTKLRDRSGQLAFNRMRDYLWWNLREMLQNDEIDLPDDDELQADLLAPRWHITSAGKIQVEPKDETRKRLGRSPDTGDAVCLACLPDTPAYKPLFGFF